MRTLGALREIWGAWGSTGTIDVPGSADWTCNRTATGVYVVRFPPFRGVAFTAEANPTGYALVGVTARDAGMVEFRVWVPNTGTGFDAGGLFRIAGPR